MALLLYPTVISKKITKVVGLEAGQLHPGVAAAVVDARSGLGSQVVEQGADGGWNLSPKNHGKGHRCGSRAGWFWCCWLEGYQGSRLSLSF